MEANFILELGHNCLIINKNVIISNKGFFVLNKNEEPISRPFTDDGIYLIQNNFVRVRALFVRKIYLFFRFRY